MAGYYIFFPRVQTKILCKPYRKSTGKEYELCKYKIAEITGEYR